MPRDTEYDALVFAIAMALMSYRTGPVDERRKAVREMQARHIIARLERSGWRIVCSDRDTSVMPTNIG